MAVLAYFILIVSLVTSVPTNVHAVQSMSVCNTINKKMCVNLSVDKLSHNASVTIDCPKGDANCTGRQEVILNCTGDGNARQCSFSKKESVAHSEVCKQFNSVSGDGEQRKCSFGKVKFKCTQEDSEKTFEYSIIYSPEGGEAAPLQAQEVKETDAAFVPAKSVRMGVRTASSAKLSETISNQVTCTPNGHVRIQLMKQGAVVAKSEKCSAAELTKSGIMFIKTGNQWQSHCGTEAIKKTVPGQGFNPKDATKAKNAEEFHKNLKDNPGKPQRLDTEYGVVIAQCEKDGKCALQVFKKNPDGTLTPGRYNTDGVTPESLSAVTKALAGENGKSVFDTIFAGEGCSGPNCKSSSCTGTECAGSPGGTPGSYTQAPGSGGSGNGGQFTPTNTSSGQKKPSPGSQKTQGQPQTQVSQQPFLQPPMPYCASVTANKQEITVGESAVIQWSIPYAIRFEVRGGSAVVNGNSAVVRPRETTSYSVIGYGVPGSTSRQFNTQFGSQMYNPIAQQGGLYSSQSPQYQMPQFGSQQNQPSCGIKDAACCQPVTIVVNQKPGKDPADVVVDDVDTEPETDFTTTIPELRCAPKKSVEIGKGVVVIWSCPEGSERSTTIAQHVNGTLLASTESFYGEGKLEGNKKMYPESDTTYTVRCINKKGKRSQSASCTVATTEPSSRQATHIAPKSNITDMQLSITASAPKIRARSEEVTITWKSSGAETCSLEGPNGYTQENTKSGTVSGVSETAGTITFTLTCKAKGIQKAKKVSIEVFEN